MQEKLKKIDKYKIQIYDLVAKRLVFCFFLWFACLILLKF